MSILDSIRQRPDNQKKVFALVSAGALTLVIVALWFSFTRDSAPAETTQKEENKLSSVSPIQMIKDEFSKAFSDMKKNTDELLETGAESTSTVPIEVIEATSTASSTEMGTTTEIIN